MTLFAWAQMMHTLLPGGLLLHAEAPSTFCKQLLAEGTLPLLKVNTEARATAKRLEVSRECPLHTLPKAYASLEHGRMCPGQWSHSHA